MGHKMMKFLCIMGPSLSSDSLTLLVLKALTVPDLTHAVPTKLAALFLLEELAAAHTQLLAAAPTNLTAAQLTPNAIFLPELVFLAEVPAEVLPLLDLLKTLKIPQLNAPQMFANHLLSSNQ